MFDDWSESRPRYRQRSSCGFLTVSAVFVAIVFAVVLLFIFRPGPLASIVPPIGHKGVIEDYLRQNLHDPEGMEFVTWEEPRPSRETKGAIEVKVRVRAKNQLGARRIVDYVFVLKDNRVLSAESDD